jgi:hypothetical protein
VATTESSEDTVVEAQMTWRGFAQRFAGLHDADAALGPRRNSLAATARPTDTATALKVRGAAAQERVSRQPAMIAATRASSRTRGEHRLVTTMSDSTLQDCLLSTILRRGE